MEDDNYAHPCVLQLGVCEGSVRNCIDGTPMDCGFRDYSDHSPLYSNVFGFGEVLCDGFDNDCDGTADESCDPWECLDTGVVRVQDSSGTISIQPAFAHGPLGTGLVAWVERDQVEGGEVFGAVVDVANLSVFGSIWSAGGNRDGPVGRRSEPAVVYDPTRSRYVLAYRADSGLSVRTVATNGRLGAEYPIIATDGHVYGPPRMVQVGGETHLMAAYYDLGAPARQVYSCSSSDLEEWNCQRAEIPAEPVWTDFDLGAGRVDLAAYANQIAAVVQSAQLHRVTLGLIRSGVVNRLHHFHNQHGAHPAWPVVSVWGEPQQEMIEVHYFDIDDVNHGYYAYSTWNPRTFQLTPIVVNERLSDNADSLTVLRHPDRQEWVTVWHEGGRVRARVGTLGTEGSLGTPRSSVETPFRVPVRNLGADRELRTVNPIFISRTGAVTGVDVLYLNAYGIPICPGQ